MVLDDLVHSDRVNAINGWFLAAVVGLGAIQSVLTNAYLWGGVALLVVILISLPAISARDWTEMVPWPMLLFSAFSVILRSFGSYPEIAGYVLVTTTALVIVVELDVFTPVELSRRFAVIFAVLTTMAIQALWTIAQFFSDQWMGTQFLRSQAELQWDFVFVTVVGVILGLLAEWYFQRFEPVGSFRRPPG